jgi:excisionase family DNA binding protein
MSVRLFAPEEIAEHLKVTRRTVYRWIESGELRACKAGKHWRVREPDLEAFLLWNTPAGVADTCVLEHEAGTALDIEISRNVLGHEVLSTAEGFQERLPNGELRKVAPYSTDPRAAQQLRDELRTTKGWELVTSPPGKPGSLCKDRWYAGWSRKSRPLAGACAPTQELAICRAALKEYYISRTDLSARMPQLSMPSEILIREDRDQR